MKNVCILLDNLEVGGAERIAINIAEQMKKSGISVEIVVSKRHGEFEEQVPEDIQIVELDSKDVPFVGVLGDIFALSSYLNKADHDGLISFKTNTNILSPLARLISDWNGTILIREMGLSRETFNNSSTLKFWATIALAALTYRIADELFVVSEGVSKEVRKTLLIDEDKITKVYNPVISESEIGHNHPWPCNEWFQDDYTVIVAAGRLVSAKSFDTLIKSVPHLLAHNDNIRVLILGDGEKKQKLNHLSRELGVEQYVDLMGYVSNPNDYIYNSSLFVLSSIREGLPTVLIEALACGTPIVSTNCEYGPEEILCSGKYGTLVPTNDPQRLAEGAIEEITNPTKKEMLLERAKYFTIENQTKKYIEALYD